MKIQKSPYLIVLQDVYSSNKGVLRDLLMYKDFDISYVGIINCFNKPTEYESAINLHGKKQIDFLLKNKLLLDSVSMWNSAYYGSIRTPSPG